jgi:hypothetical protein
LRVLSAVSIAVSLIVLCASSSEAAKRRRHRQDQPAAPAAAAPAEPGASADQATQAADATPAAPARWAAAARVPAAPAAEPASPPPPPPPPSSPPATMAPLDAVAPSGPPPANAPVPVKGKWSPVLYGFVELDTIRDSTQSLQEPAGNGAIQRPETFAGSHPRAMFGVRNSRIGIRLTAPEFEGIKVSGVLEMDFLGNQPPGITEVAFFSNPGFRVRHFMLKVESHYVDFLFGQYWQLFGWQSSYHPAAVEIQGLPAQVFSRTPQARLSHPFKSGGLTVEAAVAAARPPERDSGIPDGQAGLRVMFSGRKALHTVGGAATSVDPFGIGVSGVFRQFVMPELVAAPVATRSANGWGVSIDTLLPLIPATLDERGNGLTLTGSFVVGSGIADLYTGLTGGIPAPSYPMPAMGTALAFPVDAGLVAFDGAGALRTIDWTSYIAGVQYFLPPAGTFFLSANYSHMSSKNILQLAPGPAGVFTRSDWIDGNVFYDLTPAVRFGLEYAYFRQTRGDGVAATNHRVQLSSWLIF